MNEKVKLFFAGIGAAIILIAGTVIGIITGRNRKTTSPGQNDLDQNNSDIRSQLNNDRDRTEESGRIMAESKDVAQRMGDVIESGSESTDRTGKIIKDTRNSVSKLIDGSE